jgi:hypothetical protein
MCSDAHGQQIRGYANDLRFQQQRQGTGLLRQQPQNQYVPAPSPSSGPSYVDQREAFLQQQQMQGYQLQQFMMLNNANILANFYAQQLLRNESFVEESRQRGGALLGAGVQGRQSGGGGGSGFFRRLLGR